MTFSHKLYFRVKDILSLVLLHIDDDMDLNAVAWNTRVLRSAIATVFLGCSTSTNIGQQEAQSKRIRQRYLTIALRLQ